MPPRPSRNLDRALIAAGQALYPTTGCAGLTIRQVAEAAGVNIGMFHYHFKTREAFLRAVMQATYEDMFARLPLPPEKVARDPDVLLKDLLRAGLGALGHWAREHRQFLARLVCDCMSGETVAREFFAANFPRHIELVGSLIAAAQANGELRPMPVSQAIAFCAGAISLPMLVAGAVVDAGTLPKARQRALESEVLSKAAVDQRVDLVLIALSNPEVPTPKKVRK
jgi:AcrR family transcriptional regulator